MKFAAAITLSANVQGWATPSLTAMMGFLARWTRHLSWRQTARSFQTSWEAVYRSLGWFMRWGWAQRKLEGVQSIGVKEIHGGGQANPSHPAPGSDNVGRGIRQRTALCLQQ